MNLHVYCDGSYLLQYHGILNKCGAGVVVKDDSGNILFEKGRVIDTTKANDYEIKAIGYAVSLLISLMDTTIHMPNMTALYFTMTTLL